MKDDEPGEAELRPLLRGALAALRQMQQDESVRPKLKEFAEGKMSSAELKQLVRGQTAASVTLTT